MRGGSRFPESQNVLANFAFSFQGVLERNQETQRPAGSRLQRAGGEEKECTGERSRARVRRKVSVCPYKSGGEGGGSGERGCS